MSESTPSTFERLRQSRSGGGKATTTTNPRFQYRGAGKKPSSTIPRRTSPHRSTNSRPAPSPASTIRREAPKQPKTPPPVLDFNRDDSWDREFAYIPDQPRDGSVIHYRKPAWQEILTDLAMRLLEVAIAAIAQEIVYFFTMRRFVPQYHYDQAC